MTDTETMQPDNPRAGENAAAAGATASPARTSPADAPTGPIDVARLERRLYDFVMGDVTLTGMQAEAAISLLKQARSAPPEVVKRRKPRRKAS